MYTIALQIFGFCVNYDANLHIPPTSESQWMTSFALQLVPGSLLVSLLLLRPESPRWLVKAVKSDAAREYLSRIRCLPADDNHITWEMECDAEQLSPTGTLLLMAFGIDQLGRRKSMHTGSCGALMAMFYLAAYTKISHPSSAAASFRTVEL
ncbi:putative General substrate transporter [Seiridium cardinale]|uniref:General substrate transporter n=1 Tax=Seiridium cardinale TaxID=138064 RepID=A0ABR2XD45_9PEZI